MPKKQTSKKPVRKPVNNKQRSDLRAFWDKYWALIVGTAAIFLTVIAVLIFIAVSHVNNQNAINTQRKQFDAAEASLDALYAQIIKEVGQPTKVDKDKSCGYASADWYKGQLSCGISISLYPANTANISDAERLSKQIDSVISSNDAFSDFRAGADKNNEFVNQGVYYANSYYKSNTGLNCYAAYELDPSGNRSPNIYRATVSCYSTAKSEFYPVKN